MPTATRRSIAGGPLQPADDNVVVANNNNTAAAKKEPPMTPGKKVQKLEAELEEKNAQNKALQSQIDQLTNALDGITLVKQKIENINVEIVHNAVHKKNDDVATTMEDAFATITDAAATEAGEEGEEGTAAAAKTKKPRAKKDKNAPVPAKTAYKFYCDANPPKKDGDEKDMRLAWKEAAPEIRQVFINLAEADKARFQRENFEYTTEKEALQKYYEKQTQDVAMELLDATLVAQAALDKVQAEKKKNKKHKKDPEAPKHPISSYLYFVMDKRESVVQANPEAKQTEITTMLGEMWKTLEKGKAGVKGTKKYEDMAAKDKARYEEEKAVYDAMMAERKAQADQEKIEQLQHDKEEAMKLMKERVQDAATVVSASVAGAGVASRVVDDMSVLTDDNTKNTKQPRKKKDPNAPKKNLTAYIYFCTENRDAIKAKMPADTKNAELLTEIGRQWKELAPKKKEKYDKLATKDKARYAKEMEAYNKTKVN